MRNWHCIDIPSVIVVLFIVPSILSTSAKAITTFVNRILVQNKVSPT